MKRLLILLSFIQIFVFVNAQVRFELSELGIFSSRSKGTGKIYFNHPAEFNDIIKSKVKVAKKERVWRVRIYMGTGNDARETASAIRAGFVSEYPNIEADTRYPSPYFKVLVGSFDTRIKAESFRVALLKKYPNSRVESDMITVGSDR